MSESFEASKQSAINTRQPWIAVVLSLTMIGFGQIYCGKLVRGLFFVTLGALSIPMTGLLVATQPQRGFSLAILCICWISLLATIATIDAYCLARRTRSDYILKEYNQQAAYTLLSLIFLGSVFGGALFVREFLISAFVVPVPTMCPTIQVGERVLANKRAYDHSDPQRADIIVFRDPEKWRRNCIKRIIAIEGDTVEIRLGQVLVNGQELDHMTVDSTGTGAKTQGQLVRETNAGVSYSTIQPVTPESEPNLPALTVPPHYCFVLGDNRADSRDSRQFGPVPYASIIARADYLYWPVSDWSRFGRLSR